MAPKRRTQKRSCKKVKTRCNKKKVKCFSRKTKQNKVYVVCKCGRKVLRRVCVRRSKRTKKGGHIRDGSMQHFVTCGGKLVNG